MRNRERREASEEPSFDMTPMIDVTFLLLIFFLCLEFKTLEGKLASELPRNVGPSTQTRDPSESLELRIQLVEAGQRVPESPTRSTWVGHRVRYELGARRIASSRELEALLRREAGRRLDEAGRPLPLDVHAARGVVYGDVTSVLDIAHDAGFERIRFGSSR